MHSDHLHTMIPLERYRDIIGALDADRESWADGFWMRIAAQAAVMCPDTPDQLAHRIRHIASALRERTRWYSSMASPVRFAVAAMLIQHHIPVADFLGECARAAEVFHEVGLRHHGFYETMAVLILRLSSKHPSPSRIEADRIKSIYDHMKKFHWWLTGPSDLPACAALASCPGDAEVVAARAEDAFQQLHGSGLVKGAHLQTTANILPVFGLKIDDAVSRYRGFKTALESRTGILDEDGYDALSMLTLLDHPAELVIDRLNTVRSELDLFQPEQCGSANLLIAADLTVLDLIRMRRDLMPKKDPHDIEAMIASIHAFHIASAVLVSQISPDLIQPIGAVGTGGWPYLYP
jgi:hypothetical protein